MDPTVSIVTAVGFVCIIILQLVMNYRLEKIEEKNASQDVDILLKDFATDDCGSGPGSPCTIFHNTVNGLQEAFEQSGRKVTATIVVDDSQEIVVTVRKPLVKKEKAIEVQPYYDEVKPTVEE